MKIKILTQLLVFAALILSACAASSPWQELPTPAPTARFSLLNGEYVPLEQYRGRVVMLAFWAASCSASKGLMADLNELASATNSNKVVFLATSIDRAEEEKRLFGVIQSMPLDKLTHAFSGNEGYDEAFNAFRCVDVPHLFIIDELGNIVSHTRSASAGREYLEQRGLL